MHEKKRTILIKLKRNSIFIFIKIKRKLSVVLMKLKKKLSPYLYKIKPIIQPYFVKFQEKILPIIHNHPHYKILKAHIAKFPMSKSMRIMLISMFILFGFVFAYQAFKQHMLKKYMSSQNQPSVTVSTIKAEKSDWQDKLSAAANLRAIKGVSVTAELSGMVRNIYFQPGASVKKDEVLVELNLDTDIATLKALESSAALAKIVFERDTAQFNIKAISKAQLDTDAADLKSKTEQALAQATVVAKKVIKAPFDGKLGVSQVNPGQFLNGGDAVVTLQQLDPIYVDFFLPQQELAKIQLGQNLNLKIDTYPTLTFSGKITTINPLVDPDTRNVQVEATISNPEDKLLPGMFGQVNLDIDKPEAFLTLPQTAISYNPYGDMVYIVNQSDKKDDKGKPILTAKQTFVKLGNTRGDQIAILSGIKEGDIVVTSGQLKLKNGSPVTINNSVLPANNPHPTVENNQ